MVAAAANDDDDDDDDDEEEEEDQQKEYMICRWHGDLNHDIWYQNWTWEKGLSNNMVNLCQ